MILKALVSCSSLDEKALIKTLEMDASRINKILVALEQEGFIVREGNLLRIA